MSIAESTAGTAQPSPSRQKQPPTPSAEALYRLIGQEPPGAAVHLDDAKQRAAYLALQAQQLRIAAELERGALDSWMPKHITGTKWVAPAPATDMLAEP